MQYTISGKVIRGDGYGKNIGFPTINIDRRNFRRLKNKPKFGVYAGVVHLEARPPSREKVYKSGIVIGPLDKRGLPKLEAHLIGYNGNAYGKSATFRTTRFIRKYRNFKTEQELISQIKKDLKRCSQV